MLTISGELMSRGSMTFDEHWVTADIPVQAVTDLAGKNYAKIFTDGGVVLVIGLTEEQSQKLGDVMFGRVTLAINEKEGA